MGICLYFAGICGINNFQFQFNSDLHWTPTPIVHVNKNHIQFVRRRTFEIWCILLYFSKACEHSVTISCSYDAPNDFLKCFCLFSECLYTVHLSGVCIYHFSFRTASSGHELIVIKWFRGLRNPVGNSECVLCPPSYISSY